MFDNYSLGRRVAAFRQQFGYSQESLAEKADLSTEYISQIERGTKNPTVRSIQKICTALSIPLSVFFMEEVTIPDVLDTQIEAKIRSKTAKEKKIILEQLELLENYKSTE